MDMIGHQAEAEYGQLVGLAISPQQLEVHEAIAVGFEDLAPGVASLRDVVRHTDCDDAGHASHTQISVVSAETSQENVPSVPALKRLRIRGYFQFTTTVMGSCRASAVLEIIRKRWPSPVTA